MRIYPVDVARPGPGDVVMVLRGVYTRPEESERAEKIRGEEVPGAHEAAVRIQAEAAWHDQGVVQILEGGTPEAPLVYRGEGPPVVDAREQSLSLAGIAINANHVVVEEFEVRRALSQGAIHVNGVGVKVRDCQVHRGTGGVFVYDSSDIEITGNIIRDLSFTGSPGITLRHTSRASVSHNTVIDCPEGISLERSCQNIAVERNLLTRCTRGIVLTRVSEADEAKMRISGNLLWQNGVAHLSEMREQHFAGFSKPPLEKNLIAAPKFLSYDESSPNFLKVHVSSPCAPGPSGSIGARDAGEWPKLPTSKVLSRNLLANGSFEARRFNWLGDTNLTTDEAFDGQTSALCGSIYSALVRLAYGATYTLSFYAKAETAGAVLHYGLWYPSYQRLLTIGTEAPLTTAWARYTYTFTQPPDIAREAGIYIYASGDSKVWVDAVQLEQGSSTTLYGDQVEVWLDTGQPAQFLEPGRPLLLTARNRTEAPQTIVVSLRLRGALHGEFQPRSVRLNLAPSARVTRPVYLDAKATGLLLITCTTHDGKGRIFRKDVFRVAVGPNVSRRDDRRRFFAAGDTNIVAFSNRAGEEFIRRCAALGQMGVDYFRIWAGPDHLRQALGPQRELVDRALAIAEQHGIDILLCLENYPDTEIPAGNRYIPEGLDAWMKLVEEFVKEFGARVSAWELMNEPNSRGGEEENRLTPEIYLEICRRLYTIIKAANPQALVLGGSIVMDYESDFSRAVMKGIAGKCDAFAIHPYRYSSPNPDRGRTYESELDYVQERLREGGASTRVGGTEQGWSTTSPEINRLLGYRCWYGDLPYDVGTPRLDVDEGERLQLRYGFKMLLTTLARGGPCYSWHTWSNLFHDDFKPTALLAAVRFTAWLLDGAVSAGRLDLGPDFRGYLFSATAGRSIAAIWPVDSEFSPQSSVEVSLAGARRLQAWDAVGTKIPVHLAGARKTALISLDCNPIWLQFEGASVSEVKGSLERSFRLLRPIPSPKIY